MRRAAALLACAAVLTACSGQPRVCRETLCAVAVGGSYRVSGWNSSVLVNKDVPIPPVPSHSKVEVLDGETEFANGDARVIAGPGSAFTFNLSTGAVPVLSVASGSIRVRQPGAAEAVLPAGSSLELPADPKTLEARKPSDAFSTIP